MVNTHLTNEIGESLDREAPNKSIIPRACEYLRHARKVLNELDRASDDIDEVLSAPDRQNNGYEEDLARIRQELPKLEHVLNICEQIAGRGSLSHSCGDDNPPPPPCP